MSPEAKPERQEITLPVLKELLLEKAAEVHASQKPRSFTVGRISDSVMFEAIKRYAPHVLIADISTDGPYCSFTLPSSKYYRNVGLVCDIIVTFDPDFSHLGVSVDETEKKKLPLIMLPRRTERLIFPEQNKAFSTRKTGEEETKPRAQRPEKQKSKQDYASLLREKAGIPPDQEIDAANFEEIFLTLAQEVDREGKALVLPNELFPTEKYTNQILGGYGWEHPRSKWWFRNLVGACRLLLNRNPRFFPFNLDVVDVESVRNPQISLVPRKKEVRPPEKPKPQLEKPPRRKPEAQSTRERTIKQKGPSLVEITEDLTTKALETGKLQTFPSFPPEQFRRIYDEAVELLAGAPHSTHTPRLIKTAVEKILGRKGYTKKGFKVSLLEVRDPETNSLRFGQLTIYPPKKTFLPSASK